LTFADNNIFGVIMDIWATEIKERGRKIASTKKEKSSRTLIEPA